MTDFDQFDPRRNPVGGAPSSAPAEPAGAPAAGGLDYADIGKGAAGGLGRGVAGTVGLPGTIGNAMRWGAGQLGVPESVIDAGAKAARYIPQLQMFTGPDAGQVQRTMEGVTGKFYEPKTVAGQYASTLAEFAPGAFIPGGGGVGARVLNTVVPAITSETAGQYFKGTAAEPYARLVGGVAGGLGAAKVITPTGPPTAARRAAVDVLEGQGIPVTAGERTGSKALQWLEATAGDMPLSSGAVRNFKERQANAFDRYVTDQMFDPAALARQGVEGTLPNQAVAAAGRRTLNNEYNRLSNANELHNGPTFQRELQAAQDAYERLALPSQRPGGARDIAQVRDDITNAIVNSPTGRMPGDVYQATRSRLGTLSEGAQNDAPLANAFRQMRNALDAQMRRRLPPGEAAAWDLNNRRWANMRQTEQAVARGGEHLSPQAVAQSVRAGRAGQYAQGGGNMDEVVRAASDVIKPMPQSGTAPRQGWQQLFGLPGMLSGGGGVAGSAFGPVGTVVGAMAPHVAARAAVSRPGQAYLGNQVLPQNARDIITQTLVEQGISQPSGNDRNARERAAYEEQRQADLVAAGLARPRPGYRVTRENGVTRIVPIN